MSFMLRPWILALLAVAPITSEATTADEVFIDGTVLTPKGTVEAVAVSAGKIVATGSTESIMRLKAPGTMVIDLHGRTLMPGLFDSHVHPMEGGFIEQVCHILQGADAKQLLATVADCVKATKPGGWVTGGQWQAISMGSTPITRQTLDSVSPDTPVAIYDISGHSVWANSRALALAGIGHDTKNPPDGIIERDDHGDPTGILREAAGQLVIGLIPPPTPEENAEALARALNTLLSYGVTSLIDAQLLHDNIVAYDMLADAGRLKQNVQGCIAYKHAPDFDDLLARRQSFARPHFRTDCVKVFMDGVPTDSHTAAMIDDYATGQKNAPPRGLLLVPPAEIDQHVIAWDKMGLTVKFHSVGDLAVRTALDAIEAARKANGASGLRHDPGHLTFIATSDIPRAHALGATLEFSPYLWDPSPIDDDITKAIGPERIKRAWPIREGFASGALVVGGSDWPVIPEPNPWVGIETSVTRRNPGGGDAAFAPDESITLDQAFAMFTINGARQMGDEAVRGSIEIGKFADLVVADRNPFTIKVTDIHNLQVEQTYIAGRKVYDRGAAAP